ncbi:3-oxoadipate enol-lactonase [Nocardioides mesophilus]|uniref:3-oxoadipate enol-lactonase n=1 Tax=Nocardioides mesophilus TaxID=433659 RepID=A0A7G9R6W3_9ACTN|nr:3-oxoadipate enol-lactonase [Nocardioides mesophilus]QNN51338.1 3-oxoadipate enol-lactonase [Nocardioides mesophilus]
MPAPVKLHHRIEGEGPTVLVGSSLGATLTLWDDLAADLARDHRVIRFDTRGHGGSPVPAGPYTVEELAADVVALADSLGVERFGYVGISLGGAIGQLLALDHSDRLTSLALCCTAPRFGEPATWVERARQVRAGGLEPLVAATTERWFTERFRREHPDTVGRVMADFVAQPVEGYAGCCEALATYDVTDRLAEIDTPTLVVAGADDPSTTPEVAGQIATAVPRARLVVVADAAHMANVAQPEAVRAAVRTHLEAAR